VHAPVENADMLYALYENVDKNPRVKFKFWMVKSIICRSDCR
jgi:hypothetical protein